MKKSSDVSTEIGLRAYTSKLQKISEREFASYVAWNRGNM